MSVSDQAENWSEVIVLTVVLSLMANGLAHSVCGGCRQPFLVPEAIIDVVDEGIYVVVLDCKNCERATLAEMEDAELEALERELDRGIAEIAAHVFREHF